MVARERAHAAGETGADGARRRAAIARGARADYTDSMQRSPGAIGAMERAATGVFLPALNEDALVSVTEFHREDRDAIEVVPFTVDRGYLNSAIAGIQGNTRRIRRGVRLFDTLLTAIRASARKTRAANPAISSYSRTAATRPASARPTTSSTPRNSGACASSRWISGRRRSTRADPADQQYLGASFSPRRLWRSWRTRSAGLCASSTASTTSAGRRLPAAASPSGPAMLTLGSDTARTPPRGYAHALCRRRRPPWQTALHNFR